MSDERLKELEAICRAAAPGTKVTVDASDVQELMRELRQLRKHASALSAHQSTIENLHVLLVNLRTYAERSFEDDDSGSGSGRVPIQDPGR